MSVDLVKLRSLFKEINAQDPYIYADMFTLLCYLHKEGQTIAATKLMRDLLKTINKMSEEGDQWHFFQQVLIELPGNEKEFGLAVSSREEMKNTLR